MSIRHDASPSHRNHGASPRFFPPASAPHPLPQGDAGIPRGCIAQTPTISPLLGTLVQGRALTSAQTMPRPSPPPTPVSTPLGDNRSWDATRNRWGDIADMPLPRLHGGASISAPQRMSQHSERSLTLCAGRSPPVGPEVSAPHLLLPLLLRVACSPSRGDVERLSNDISVITSRRIYLPNPPM